MFIHGLVRDDQGRKMSKSLGNGIDPLEMAEKYGADALRFNLVTGNSPGNDMRFYTERCEAMRNFANKIWNASRFLMMNLTIEDNALPEQLELEDKWILSKLNTVIREVTENMDHYELGVAAQKLYDFIWDTYCDWYIEMTKARLQGDNPAAKEQAQQVLCYVLTDILKLLAPLHALPHRGDLAGPAPRGGQRGKVPHAPILAPVPPGPGLPQEEKAVELLMDAVKAVRTRRSEMNVPLRRSSPMKFVSKAPEAVVQQERDNMEDPGPDCPG